MTPPTPPAPPPLPEPNALKGPFETLNDLYGPFRAFGHAVPKPVVQEVSR
jgi:hypothetical protein